jgi:hypothetical protein
LDSLGNVARGGGGGGGGWGGVPAGLPPEPMIPIDQTTGLPINLPANEPTNLGWLPQEYNPLMFPNPGATPLAWPGLDDAQVQRTLAYYNAALPWAQFHQNAYQYDNDFNETVRRFDLEFPQRQREAAFQVAGRAQLPNARFISYR